MRTRQLVSFLAVCEIGSISRAAERLYIAQPALGLQIRALEDEMGAQLLTRHSRGIQATPAGEIVLEWARQTLGDIERLKGQLREFSAGVAASVTLGLTPSLATAFAVPILGMLQQAMPDLRVQLVEAVSHVLDEWIGTGQVDLALVFDGVTAAPVGASTLLSERLYYISENAQGEPTAPTIEFAEIADFPLAIQAPNDAIRMTVQAAADKAGLTLRFDYQIQSFGVMFKLIRAGLANAVLPLPMVFDQVRDGILTARKIISPELTRQLLWRQNAGYAQPAALDDIKRLIARAIRDSSKAEFLSGAYTFHSVD